MGRMRLTKDQCTRLGRHIVGDINHKVPAMKLKRRAEHYIQTRHENNTDRVKINKPPDAHSRTAEKMMCHVANIEAGFVPRFNFLTGLEKETTMRTYLVTITEVKNHNSPSETRSTILKPYVVHARSDSNLQKQALIDNVALLKDYDVDEIIVHTTRFAD